MHPTSMNNMQYFCNKYLKGHEKVLDVGSMDVNGSYKSMFNNYTGLDIATGLNVDIVADDPYEWDIEDGTFDAVISGQTFEHVEFPEKTMKEIGRVLKPGGFVCIIAPSTGPKHDYPGDYRRYSEEMICDLARMGGLKKLESRMSPVGVWKDAMIIAEKPKDKKKK